MSDPRVRLMVAQGVARLAFARPDRRNALDHAMWEAIPALVAEAMRRPDVRLLLLASDVPGVFSAGADIAEFAARSPDPQWRARNRQAIRAAQQALAHAPKPTLAVVDGDCVGGGCGLVMACDLRVASPASRFGITPARLGLVYPLHDTKLLVDLVGPSWAKRLLLTGTLVDGATAERIGLVTELAADPDARARALVEELLAASADSQRWTKAVIARVLAGQADDDAETNALFEGAFDGPDFRMRAEAFLKRRRHPE
ncbi:MAG: enoyl-CoA hydratase-related protein [Sphingomonadaceae bacterium]|uniref:enoyl-CoA hydratase/isomerase family protein n=1 Tax=Thermaurantiacus sp. TaxID=2820283 RepID=UPI00298F3439|nr:enoyl-CoA hydratase-related protein [Thermaurantiacus sp.]MCS6986139.1 enoyl-CoA hydratase-related protein [Sphingomonadaceae bacterium]MDW8414635.1 enoyl-CoA hydratase-related protein [Thermaurantiacus sp.]